MLCRDPQDGPGGYGTGRASCSSRNPWATTDPDTPKLHLPPSACLHNHKPTTFLYLFCSAREAELTARCRERIGAIIVWICSNIFFINSCCPGRVLRARSFVSAPPSIHWHIKTSVHSTFPAARSWPLLPCLSGRKLRRGDIIVATGFKLQQDLDLVAPHESHFEFRHDSDRCPVCDISQRACVNVFAFHRQVSTSELVTLTVHTTGPVSSKPSSPAEVETACSEAQ